VALKVAWLTCRYLRPFRRPPANPSRRNTDPNSDRCTAPRQALRRAATWRKGSNWVFGWVSCWVSVGFLFGFPGFRCPKLLRLTGRARHSDGVPTEVPELRPNVRDFQCSNVGAAVALGRATPSARDRRPCELGF
jgi:hypothetical protein